MKYTICEKCQKEIANCSIKAHLNSCGVPRKARKKSLKKRSSPAWNKGLTIEDARVKKYGAKISVALLGKPGHSPSEEHRKILSKAAKDRGFGGVTQSRWIEYKGFKLGSSYELKLAESLDLNNVKWIQPSKLKYTDNLGNVRSYTADFYLPDYDVYLDPKNDFLINNINPSLGFFDKEKIKWASEQNSISVLILNKNQLDWQIVKLLLTP